MCDQHVSKTWTTSLEVFQEELVLGYWNLSLTWFPVVVFKIFRSSRKKNPDTRVIVNVAVIV